MARCGIVFLLILLSLGASPAVAQPRSVFLDELTWTEVRDAIQAGKTTVILPIGGTEQNGPHMALGKHNVRVRHFAEKIAVGLGNALVAPVLAYVPEGGIAPPTGHMRFPGTITVPEEVFERTLESAARSFRLHGLRDIVFIGDHGGYQKNMRKAADTLNREWAKSPVRAHAIEEYYTAAEIEFAKALKAKGFTSDEIGTHAGLADTSLALAVDPKLVRADRLAAPTKGKVEGVYGDPRRATAELGRLGTDLVIERTVEAVRKSTARR